MKKKLFEKYFDHEVHTINLSRKTVIERMRQMNGNCRNEDSEGWHFQFHCNKRGNFFVDRAGDNGTTPDYNNAFFVRGRIFEENNQTKIEFCSVQIKGSKFDMYFSAVFSVISFIAIIAVLILTKIEFTSKLLVCVLLMAFNVAYPFFRTRNEFNHKDVDLTNMRAEVLRRIDAVNKWDK